PPRASARGAGAAPPRPSRGGRACPARGASLLSGGARGGGPSLRGRCGVGRQLAAARRVAADRTFELWRPQGRPRVRLLASGRFYDGWLARSGRLVVYPDASGRTTGTLRLALALGADTQPTPLRLTAAGFERTVLLPPGE